MIFLKNAALNFWQEYPIELQQITECETFMSKLNRLKDKIDLTKIKKRSNGRFYIRLDGKQYTASSYKALIDKLYDIYFGKCAKTLEDLYPEWMIYRRDIEHRCPKTIVENNYLWNSLLAESAIVKIPIPDLTVSKLDDFFHILVSQKELTKKRFCDMKSILNGIFYFAVRRGLIQVNPLLHMNFRHYNFSPENQITEIYTIEERAKLLAHLRTIEDSDPYSLAIQFDFYVIARIGELKALKWTDFDEERNVIRIQSQIVARQTLNDDLSFSPVQYQYVDYVKGKSNVGYRDVPLTEKTRQILERAKQQNPDGEYIFMPEGKQMTTISFNRHLKKHCNAIGIPYRSSHKIRFTVASLLYHKHQVDTPILQRLLGHTSLNMTFHYLKPVDDIDGIAEIMTKVLDF